MSTISDALKKAQTQRGGNRPDQGHPGFRTEPRDPNQKGNPLSPWTSKAPWALIILLFLALAVMYFRGTVRSERTPPARTVPTIDSASIAAPPAPLPVTPPEAETTAPATLAETAPPVAREEIPVVAQPISPPRPRAELPVLTATFYAEKNPVAIINGRSLMQGEKSGAYEVIKILPTTVILKANGEEHEIALK